VETRRKGGKTLKKGGKLHPTIFKVLKRRGEKWEYGGDARSKG